MRAFTIGKYANKTPHEHLQTIFSKAPGLVGKWLKYSTLDPKKNSSAEVDFLTHVDSQIVPIVVKAGAIGIRIRLTPKNSN